MSLTSMKFQTINVIIAYYALHIYQIDFLGYTRLVVLIVLSNKNDAKKLAGLIRFGVWDIDSQKI